MKRVLVVFNGYPMGEDAGDKIRVFNMLSSLQAIGLQVFFLAFYKKGFSHKKIERRKVSEGIKSLFVYTLPDRFGLNTIATWWRAIVTWWYVKIFKIDYVQLETSLSASCAMFLGKQIPVITDFHADPVPELQMNKRSASCIKQAEKDIKYALRRSQKVIAVSHNLIRNLGDYHPFQSASYILPCCFNEQLFPTIDEQARTDLKKSLNLEDRIVLCYLGGTHSWQCIAETLDLFIRLKQLDSRYFLCIYTNGDLTPFAVALDKIKDSYLCQSLPYNKVSLYLSIVDTGFVLRRNSLVNVNASPTKTAEYLASGAMVVATQYSGDAPQQIEESGCGFVLNDVQASDEELKALHEQIQRYVKDKPASSERAIQYAFRKRVWDSNEQELERMYRDLHALSQNSN